MSSSSCWASGICGSGARCTLSICKTGTSGFAHAEADEGAGLDRILQLRFGVVWTGGGETLSPLTGHLMSPQAVPPLVIQLNVRFTGVHNAINCSFLITRPNGQSGILHDLQISLFGAPQLSSHQLPVVRWFWYLWFFAVRAVLGRMTRDAPLSVIATSARSQRGQ